MPAQVAVVHLRGATPGLTLGLENCHPFVRDRAAFAQNGALYPQERLPELLPPELEATIEGSTDSERLFRLFHARYLEGARPFPEVVRDTLREVLQTYTSPVLNAMYLAPDALYVLNAHNPTSVPYAGDPPDMFAIRYRIEDDRVVVASSGLRPAGLARLVDARQHDGADGAVRRRSACRSTGWTASPCRPTPTRRLRELEIVSL